MGLRYKKGKCAGYENKCANPEGDVFIVKNHPRLGKLCKTCNDARLADEKGESSPSEQNTGGGELEVFRMIYSERAHVSFVSGERLDRYDDTQMWFSLFGHVLSKAQNKYPKFKLYKKNIVLLTPHEHHLFDHGSSDQRKKYADEMAERNIKVDWDKLFKLKEELIEEYKEKYGK